MSEVRVRFAPSPTGSLHVGNARTAILNWVFARRHGGKLILRIEDTDQERSSKESEKSILDDLRWLGLDWDESPYAGGDYGPYRQTERAQAGIYQKAVDTLKDAGRAYPCFCKAEDLDAERETKKAAGESLHYSGKCRNLADEEVEQRIAAGEEYAIRFRPTGEAIIIEDLALGEVKFEGDVLDDFILLRSNGLPSYNFAVVVDDSAMAITHVIRGNDHMSNTPKQVALMQALDCDLPKFAHIPMILGDDGARLSKRDGATSVGEFRDMGILANTLVNFLSLLSWSSPSGEEILGRDQLTKEFDFDRISKSAARFDRDKLKWMNGMYIRQLTPEKLAEMLRPLVQGPDDAMLRNIAKVIQPKLEFLNDATELSVQFTEAPVLTDEAKAQIANADAQKVLELFRDGFQAAGEYSEDELKGIIKNVQTTAGVKGPGLWKPLRIAITGEEHGPELVQVIEVIGFTGCAQRCVSALEQG
jgi:nondiscriminating glutamyl-tRNA synthetase